MPPPELLHERVSAVLAVLYVLFTEGYDAWAEPADDVAGAEARRALADDAVRVARLVARLLPDEPEARGLLALLLLQHARRRARPGAPPTRCRAPSRSRTGRSGRTTRSPRGWRCSTTPSRPAAPGPYQVQAAIAALHARAASADETDWAEITALYDVLVGMTRSPVVALNRAVAVGILRGPEAGLAALDDVASAPELAAYHLLPAVRADLLRRAGRPVESAVEYRRALDQVDREGDRRLLSGGSRTWR